MLSLLKANFKITLAGLCLVLGLTARAGLVFGAPPIYQGEISAFKLNIRSQPSQKSGVVAVVEKGTRVAVIAEDGQGIGGWLTVVYNGKKGFIRNRPKYILLTPVKGAGKKTAKSAPTKPKTSNKKRTGKTQSEKTGPEKTKPPKPERTAADRQGIKEKIQKETRRVADFSQKEMEIIEGLNEIDFTLNQARVKADTLSKETRELEKTIHTIQKERQDLTDQVKEKRGYAGKRLAALYRMSMIGSLDMMEAPSSVFDFVLKQNAMKRAVKSDFIVLEAQTKDLEQLAALEQDLARQRQAKSKLEKDLTLQIRIKEKESRKKEVILHEIRRKKKLSKAALESLKTSAKKLDEKMYVIEKKVFHPIDDSSFSRQKGRLSRPVKGKIITRYGKAATGGYNAFTFRNGIDIKVERGEPVHSVFKGEVMFADWLKGYGNILIINHGENYYTLYAHVQEVFKKTGEKVDTGEVIATAGDTGSIKGLCLHFEVRHHGKPVNPMKWLKKGA